MLFCCCYLGRRYLFMFSICQNTRIMNNIILYESNLKIFLVLHCLKKKIHSLIYLDWCSKSFLKYSRLMNGFFVIFLSEYIWFITNIRIFNHHRCGAHCFTVFFYYYKTKKALSICNIKGREKLEIVLKNYKCIK